MTRMNSRPVVEKILYGMLITVFTVVVDHDAMARDGDSNESQKSFTEWVSSYLEQPALKSATIGIHIEESQSRKVVYSLNGQKLLKPASTAKLFSAALFLDAMGPDYRIETPIYVLNWRDGGEAQALAILGRGDVSIGARSFDWDYSRSLEKVRSAIIESGIRKLNGPVIGEELYFKNSRLGTGWTWDDLQYYYGAEVSALFSDDNTLDLMIRPGRFPGSPCEITAQPSPHNLEIVNQTRTEASDSRNSIVVTREHNSSVVIVSGSLPLGGKVHNDAVSVADPAGWFVQKLSAQLAKDGLRPGLPPQVRTHFPSVRDESIWTHLTSAYSDPVKDLLPRMLKPSQNLHAQTFLLLVGRNRSDHDLFPSTEAAGIKSLKEFTASIGIPSTEMLLDEGSGLSRSALVSPYAAVSLLQYMGGHTAASDFRNALPIAGVDGSLRNRLTGPKTRGRIQAKTGSINHVKCLAGYMNRGDGGQGEWTFAIMLNAFDEDAFPISGKNIIDTILENLAARSIP